MAHSARFRQIHASAGAPETSYEPWKTELTPLIDEPWRPSWLSHMQDSSNPRSQLARLSVAAKKATITDKFAGGDFLRPLSSPATTAALRVEKRTECTTAMNNHDAGPLEKKAITQTTVAHHGGERRRFLSRLRVKAGDSVAAALLGYAFLGLSVACAGALLYSVIAMRWSELGALGRGSSFLLPLLGFLGFGFVFLRLRGEQRVLEIRKLVDTAGQDYSSTRAHDTHAAVRPVLYIAIILGVVLTTYAYKLRTEGIFSCQADGYTSDRYLAYCHATGYGDYEHGVFWFGLEPSAKNFAQSAEVLFLGDSRLQIAFSTTATADWFSLASIRFYLLGFSFGENHVFAQELLRRLAPRAKVYVIGLDPFFERRETPPAKIVMRDTAARIRYEGKRLWQFIHEPICGGYPSICRNQYVVFRSRKTGAYHVRGAGDWFKRGPVSDDPVVDQSVLETFTTSGRDFLSRLPVNRECVILTVLPTVEARVGTAKAVATALGMNLLAPEIGGLQTFDGSHLDQASAQRWSEAFLQLAAPQIRKCLDGTLN